MSDPRPVHRLSCHCGTVKIDLRLTNGFETIRRCTCSYCRMRGAIAASVRLEDLTIVAGAENLSLYQFNTGTAKHYFCKTCGIYTHHQRRSNPNEYGVNVACIERVSPFDFREVIVMNGVSHPSDSKGVDRIAGILRYDPVG